MAIRLYIDADWTLGGLNLSSTISESIDEDAPWIADIFAAQAAVALGRTRQVEGLTKALESRQLIGQAVGLTMAKYQLDDTAAFNYMARASSLSNVKIREIAQQMLDEHKAHLPR